MNAVLRCGYARDEGAKTVRPMTADEAKALRSGDHVIIRSARGGWVRCKVNGAPKTWKRDPQRVEVPLKFGMYETGRDTAEGGTMLRIVVEVAP